MAVVHTEPVEGQQNSTSGTRPGPRRWLLAGVLLLVVAVSSLTSVDRYAEGEYESLFQRAFITFALARTLNGVISAVQGTELALQPAGVGVTLTPGEVLDPVNDLVERFSWIMLGATISLGVQQVLLDVGQWWGVRLLVALLGAAWLWLRLRGAAPGPDAGPEPGKRKAEKTLLRVLIVLLFIRFAVPVAIIANEALYHLFLETRYVESTQVIEAAGEELEQQSPSGEAGAEDSASVEEPGLLESLGRGFGSTREALDFRQRLEALQARAADLIEHLIQLSVVFILQTGILPIVFLWIFLQLFKQLFRREI
jgi:hypothetical protein